MKNILRQRLQSRNSGLILFVGGTAAGKSFAAAAALRAHLERFPDAKVMRFVDGATEQRSDIPGTAPFRRGQAEIPADFSRMSADLYVIDEIRGPASCRSVVNEVFLSRANVIACFFSSPGESALEEIECLILSDAPYGLSDDQQEDWERAQREVWRSVKTNCLVVKCFRSGGQFRLNEIQLEARYE